MPRLLNAKLMGCKQLSSPNCVYIGRPSKWGNPFQIGVHGSRADVINAYRAWIMRQTSLLKDLPELQGKHLICWCAPLPCHGQVLLDLLEQTELHTRIGVIK